MRMVFVLALVAALIEPGAAQGTDASVVGLWLGEARTQGGLGNWIEFRADGTLEAGFGALVGGLLDDTYRFDGTTLMLHVFSGKATAAGVPIFESVRKTVRIQGDHALVEFQSPEDLPVAQTHSAQEQAMLERLRQPVTMTRVGPATPGASPIAGTWVYPHYTGQTAYETFTPSGKWYLRVPMQLRQGRYIVTPPTVTAQWTEQQSETFSRTGDVLMSGAPEGQHSTFRRAPE